MKLRDKFIVGFLIVILIFLHRHLFEAKEGFFDDSSSYAALQQRLINDLGPYCKVATFVRQQLKTMISATGGANDENSINQTYKSVYSCTDSLASSRPSCSIGTGVLGRKGNSSMKYVSCDTYMKLPDWTDQYSAILALMKITDDLPERITRESEWFAVIIDKVQAGLAAGANPPSTPPTKKQLDKLAEDAKKEGFAGTCSLEAAKIKMAQPGFRGGMAGQIAAEAATCSLPSASGEIARVNALLDSSSLKDSVSKMNSHMDKMIKLQSDLEKAKNGTLYSWQQEGPPKNYPPPFEGGDRTQSIIHSMKQNQ